MDNPRNLVMKATPPAREERQFVARETQKQEDLGVLRRIDRGKERDPVFVTNLVLVKGGQSQTDYRMCGNFV